MVGHFWWEALALRLVADTGLLDVIPVALLGEWETLRTHVEGSAISALMSVVASDGSFSDASALTHMWRREGDLDRMILGA